MSKDYFVHKSETIKATPSGTISTGCATYMSKIYFDHISETITAADLMLATGTV